MKKILIVIVSSVLQMSLNTCSKSSSETTPPPPPNNNELNAKIAFSSGDIVNINLKGSIVKMGYGDMGFTVHLYGNWGFNNHIYLGFNFTICESGPCTTTEFDCWYDPSIADGSIRYIKRYTDTNGSLTFTTKNKNYWEGYFNAVCKRIGGGETVTITGRFKGDCINCN
jgi:hypothetical protein